MGRARSQMAPGSFHVYRNSSARAIRKTALRAYCGCRRCFIHCRALGSSDCQTTDSYAGINPSPVIRWLNCYCISEIFRQGASLFFIFCYNGLRN